jgi:hypothetical protein
VKTKIRLFLLPFMAAAVGSVAPSRAYSAPSGVSTPSEHDVVQVGAIVLDRIGRVISHGNMGEDYSYNKRYIDNILRSRKYRIHLVVIKDYESVVASIDSVLDGKGYTI